MKRPAGLLFRCVAKAIDIVIVAIFFEVLHWSGLLAGILYILIADGLFEGRSLGKILLKLQTTREDGRICTVKESILRNITICLGIILWRVPVIGWLLFFVILGVEFLVLLGSDSGKRIGDILAKTTVIERNERRIQGG
jgi:uncharacterized RDD family membrane protein YckC